MEFKNIAERQENLGAWEEVGMDLIERIRMNDTEAIVQFVMEYQAAVKAVAQDVLHDEKMAAIATRDTFKSAVTQIQRGVQMGQVEPWLLWIVRNEALILTQTVQPSQAPNDESQTPGSDASEPSTLRFFTGGTASQYKSRSNDTNYDTAKAERAQKSALEAKLSEEISRLKRLNDRLERTTADQARNAPMSQPVQPPVPPAFSQSQNQEPEPLQWPFWRVSAVDPQPVTTSKYDPGAQANVFSQVPPQNREPEPTQREVWGAPAEDAQPVVASKYNPGAQESGVSQVLHDEPRRSRITDPAEHPRMNFDQECETQLNDYASEYAVDNEPELSESSAPRRRERREAPQTSKSQPTATRPSILSALVTIGMILIILVLVWVVMGLLAKNSIISLPDWGFSWFNQHLFSLF